MMKIVLMIAVTACGVDKVATSSVNQALCIEGDTSCGPAGWNPSSVQLAIANQTHTYAIETVGEDGVVSCASPDGGYSGSCNITFQIVYVACTWDWDGYDSPTYACYYGTGEPR